jgi:hypothetical protein
VVASGTKIVKTAPPTSWSSKVLTGLGMPMVSPQTSRLKKNKKVVKACKKYDLPGIINDRSHRTLIAGRSGAGKTQLALKLLKTVWRGCYSKIYIISPTFTAQFQKVWSSLDPEGIEVFFSMDDELISLLHQKCVENTKQGLDSLILIDDCGEELRRLTPQAFSLFVSNSRHCRASIVHLVQKITMSPTVFRSNCSTIIAFSATSFIDREALWRELSTVDRRTFFEMFSKATSGKYAYMASTISKHGVLGFYYMDFKTPVKLL